MTLDGTSLALRRLLCVQLAETDFVLAGLWKDGDMYRLVKAVGGIGR